MGQMDNHYYFYKNDRIDILINLYFYLSDSLQRDLQIKLKNYKFENTLKSYNEFSLLVINKILNIDTSIINNMFSKLDDILKENERSDFATFPHPGLNLMEILISLYQKHFINDKDRLMKYAIKFNSEELKWKIDPESFNYDNFDIHWLENADDYFLKELSSNKDIKSKIISKYKEVYNGQYKETSLKTLFKYFI